MKEHRKTTLHCASAMYFCKCRVVFLRSFISALFLSFFQGHSKLKWSFTEIFFFSVWKMLIMIILLSFTSHHIHSSHWFSSCTHIILLLLSYLYVMYSLYRNSGNFRGWRKPWNFNTLENLIAMNFRTTNFMVNFHASYNYMYMYLSVGGVGTEKTLGKGQLPNTVPLNSLHGVPTPMYIL